jgi:hypothetical protein
MMNIEFRAGAKAGSGTASHYGSGAGSTTLVNSDTAEGHVLAKTSFFKELVTNFTLSRIRIRLFQVSVYHYLVHTLQDSQHCLLY